MFSILQGGGARLTNVKKTIRRGIFAKVSCGIEHRRRCSFSTQYLKKITFTIQSYSKFKVVNFKLQSNPIKIKIRYNRFLNHMAVRKLLKILKLLLNFINLTSCGLTGSIRLLVPS